MAFRIGLAFLACALSSSAQVITSAIGQTAPIKTPASTTPLEKKCVVLGKVTNSVTGEPVKKVSVRLVKVGEAPSQGMFTMGMNQMEGYSETSGPDGAFKIDAIEPGEYLLSGERAGYLHSTFGAASASGQGTKITLSPGQHITGVSLALIPQSVIPGRVVDSDGDPIGNSMVMALRQTWAQGKSHYFPTGNAQSDEEGRFRLSNLEPGKYYVVAQQTPGGGVDAPSSPGKPEIRPVRTFYPEGTTRDSALAVNVKAGETAPEIEIHQQYAAGHHIRGKVAGQLGGSPETMHLQVMPDEGDSFNFFVDPRNTLKPDHTFDIAAITPGRYWITVMQFSGTIRTAAEAFVEVGDSDVNGVELVPVRPGTLRVQITLQGSPPDGVSPETTKQVRVFLLPSDTRRMLFAAQSETSNTGDITMQNVSPAKYEVAVQNLPEGTYVQTVFYGSQDVRHKVLDLSGGVGGDLQVILRYGVAEVDGTVVPPDSGADLNKKVNASVYLIPQIEEATENLRSTGLDQNAGFSFKQLPPGTYRAVAVEGLSQTAMGNPDLIKEVASHGVEIQLKENDKKRIQLPVITASDMQQIFARIGIEPE